MEPIQYAKLAFDAVDDKKAESIVCIDMKGMSSVADYFLICHGNNEKQVQAIAREVRNRAEKSGIEVRRMEGFDSAKWILVDLAEVIVHIFSKDDRLYYNLEKLWGDAPQIQAELEVME